MRTSLTSLERLEAQIRALPDGTPQGAAWEEALVRWVNAGGTLTKKVVSGRYTTGLPSVSAKARSALRWELEQHL